MLKNKRVFLFFVFSLVSLIFLSNGVLAYWNVGVGIDNAARAIQPVAQFFLGGFDYTGQLLFERFLIFLLIFSITFVALFKAPFFKDQKPAVIVISVIVPLLSVRYIDFMWMNTILMSYQVFGIALTAFLPFVIYFFFLIGVAPNNSGVRKIGWVLFLCVYLGLYTTSDNTFYGQVYMWTALFALLFLIFDGTIARVMMWNKIKDSGRRGIDDASDAVRRRMHQAKIDLDSHVIDRAKYDERMKEYEKDLKTIHKHSF